ncbi:ATP-grasp domain-containing protein [Candidatus Saccharibacteria bacterium]|nr:ATP-grasp domain-containing protein [Candidatus Saccharibacteria bacterium]
MDINSLITYNRKLPLGGIYDDQSVFLHMHHYFDDFLTISDTHGRWLESLGLADKNAELNIDHEVNKGIKIASSREFANFVKQHPRRKYVLYGPLSPPYIVNPLNYIMNSPTIAHAYEHKRYFRDEFSELINMPDHVVRRLDELDEAMFDELAGMYEKFVIQDVESSGSKGTFIVRTRSQYGAAVKQLKATSFSGSVVVSEFVDGLPCSIQACVTKYGVFTGGLQRQLVDSQYLCNVNLPGVSRWCGGELGGDSSEIVKHRMQEIATVVGSELASHGYRGIFGIDLLITPDNDVYAIEVNARLTGYTHVLSDMQFAKGKIPFALLHTLELGNFKYEVEDLEALPTMNSTSEPYSYLIFNNEIDSSFTLQNEIPSGIYQYDSSTRSVTYVKPGYSVADLASEEQFIVFCKFNKGDVIGRGKRMLKVIKKGYTMAEDGDLNKEAQVFAAAVKTHFSLPLRTEQ